MIGPVGVSQNDAQFQRTQEQGGSGQGRRGLLNPTRHLPSLPIPVSSWDTNDINASPVLLIRQHEMRRCQWIAPNSHLEAAAKELPRHHKPRKTMCRFCERRPVVLQLYHRVADSKMLERTNLPARIVKLGNDGFDGECPVQSHKLYRGMGFGESTST